MNILLWHVHGSWTTAFVQGKHTYLVPVTADRGPWGLGRARTYPWPDTVVEVPASALCRADVDVVIAQRPQELELAARWLGRPIGRDIPVIYVEHNTPAIGRVPDSWHPMADRDDVVVAHVTYYNQLFWDTGGTRTTVIEHGIVEPVVRYQGDLERIGVAINEPVRRWRVTGTDLLPRFSAVAPVDVFGMGVRVLPTRLGLDADQLGVYDDPPQGQMQTELARRRAYLHPHRWTSLGLSLLEAMTMGMPVLVLATTEATVAVPPDAGVVDTDVDALVDAARWLIAEPEAAARLGAAARRAALARYGLDRFLADWDRLLEEETCGSR